MLHDGQLSQSMITAQGRAFFALFSLLSQRVQGSCFHLPSSRFHLSFQRFPLFLPNVGHIIHVAAQIRIGHLVLVDTYQYSAIWHKNLLGFIWFVSFVWLEDRKAFKEFLPPTTAGQGSGDLPLP